MKGFQKQDLSILFVSHASQINCDKVKEHLYRSGHFAIESQSNHQLKDNLAGNKVLVVNIDLEQFQESLLREQMEQKSSDIPCLFILHCGNRELNIDLLNYCSDFVIWPCESNELFFRLHALVGSHKDKEELLSQYHDANEMIGNSQEFRMVLKRIRTFSNCDAPVLIEGETGTGKEMIARAVHYYSDRQDHPFIPVNCGALPDNLIENELFGHAKGAYTDATSSSKGLVGQASGGTLFLDEIESLTPKCQVALMRLLQEQEYKPLGTDIPIKSNVRIVTASNVGLKHLVEEGVMRQDLFFRLNILSVILPPLRERDNDVNLLAEFFLNKYRIQYQLSKKQFHDEARTWLKSYDWPGNIRELENMVHRALLISEGDYILPRDLNENIDSFEEEQNSHSGFLPKVFSGKDFDDTSFNDAKSQVIDEFERHYLSQLMENIH